MREFRESPACVGLFSFLVFVSAVMAAFYFALPARSQVQTTVNAQAQDRAVAAWGQIVTVLQNPRCLNCHQQVTPLQGDERHLHVPLVVRGPDNHGVGAMRCGNCHNAGGNNETSGTPGAGPPDLWQLAPVSMHWQGLSSRDLCEMLQDKTRNGNRDGAALIHHMEEEPLVLWSWHPGGDRKPIPLPHEEFVAAMKVWVDGGMACPKP